MPAPREVPPGEVELGGRLTAAEDRIRALEDGCAALVDRAQRAEEDLDRWRRWASAICQTAKLNDDGEMRAEVDQTIRRLESTKGELHRLRTMETYFDAVIGAVDSYREAGAGKYARGSYANGIRRADVERANAGQERLADAVDRLGTILIKRREE